MLKGNSFSTDNDEERRERLLLLSGNIADFEAEFELAPDILSKALEAPCMCLR